MEEGKEEEEEGEEELELNPLTYLERREREGRGERANEQHSQ